MDQATLVSPDISTAQKALLALDEAKIKKISALLVIFPEYGNWRFVVSSPTLDQHRQLKAYEQVTEALQGKSVYTLPTIMVLPTKDPFIKALPKIFPFRVRTDAMIHLEGQIIGNRSIVDAYVLRLAGVID